MTLVVGFAPGKDDRSPLEYAATLARSAGEDLLVVTVVPSTWPIPIPSNPDGEFGSWARERGDRAAAEASGYLAEHCPDLHTRAIWAPGRSVPGALIEQARQAEAKMIVVGSGRDGAYGYVHLSSTSDPLVHSSPVPVAIATRGYRADRGARIARVTCAFRGDEHSITTLVATAEVCERVDAAMRVATFAVRGRTMYPPEIGVDIEDQILEASVEQSIAAQERAIAALAVRPREITSEVSVGESWHAAVARLTWLSNEVLVVGSSGEGTVSRLFLGSNATKIVRHAPVPTVIVP
ncbi:universal stress protein [Epidermidibacterium keratini]|uniref:Universal stress protein n=1 Tax=Epidermidibacterium keratini TaxID=1891644 RepID=A0A7M3T535_9ACTN|nr:universal stress protein [Epidermidibacterium keratini]QHB98898.1 universal stress protein [Epidermidibacterium keratini]